MAQSSVKVIDQVSGKNWTQYHGDCVDVARGIPDNSIHLSVYSPPFESLYTYSNSERDMGNCVDSETFWNHYKFLLAEQFRYMMPGRIVAVHCMNLLCSKQHHGFIGLRDFRGEIIREHEKAGFIFHSEVCIWKDPVTAMQRTKALGLLWKQLKKDSCRSRQGVPDYLVVFQKPGDNPEPVSHTPEEFPVRKWQQYASPIWSDIVADAAWLDINPSNTLQRESAREHNDERHICPLQLQVIERAVELWSNPGDVVFSPFAGIGSEGFIALQNGRRFVGVELKASYFKQACANLEIAEAQHGLPTLFDLVEA